LILSDVKPQLSSHELLLLPPNFSMQPDFFKFSPPLLPVRFSSSEGIFFRLAALEAESGLFRLLEQIGDVARLTAKPLAIVHLGGVRSVHEVLHLTRARSLEAVNAAKLVGVACLEAADAKLLRPRP
jgi:hypothetical protein